jgi:hypothetical protein
MSQNHRPALMYNHMSLQYTKSTMAVHAAYQGRIAQHSATLASRLTVSQKSIHLVARVVSDDADVDAHRCTLWSQGDLSQVHVLRSPASHDHGTTYEQSTEHARLTGVGKGRQEQTLHCGMCLSEAQDTQVASKSTLDVAAILCVATCTHTDSRP